VSLVAIDDSGTAHRLSYTLTLTTGHRETCSTLGTVEACVTNVLQAQRGTLLRHLKWRPGYCPSPGARSVLRSARMPWYTLNRSIDVDGLSLPQGKSEPWRQATRQCWPGLLLACKSCGRCRASLAHGFDDQAWQPQGSSHCPAHSRCLPCSAMGSHCERGAHPGWLTTSCYTSPGTAAGHLSSASESNPSASSVPAIVARL